MTEKNEKLSPFDEKALDDPGRQVASLGLTCFVAWASLLLCFEGSLQDDVAGGGSVIHDPFFCAMLVTTVTLLLAASWSSRTAGATVRSNRVESLTEGPAFGVFVVMGILGSVATSLVSHSITASSLAPRPFVLAMGIITGPAVALFTLRWGRAVSGLALTDAVSALCFGLCGQWLVLAIVDLLGFAAQLLAAAVLPLLSWRCLAGLRRRGTVASTAENAARTSHAGPDRLVSPLARIAVSVFCFGFAMQTVSTFSFRFGDAPIRDGSGWLLFLAIFALTAAVARGILDVFRRTRNYRLELFYRASFAFAMLATVAFALVPDLSPSIAYTAIYVSYALLLLTAWILSYNAVLVKGQKPSHATGLVFGAELLGFLAGFMMSSALGDNALLATGAVRPKAVLAVAAMLIAAYCFILPEKELLTFSPRVIQLSRAGLEERCRVLARERGLTDREAEILALLARGRDVQFIEQELLISRNTVKTHRKNLYRKLNIHTQQELLSLVEEPV
uniref:DNA-binding response regulator n=1 Tax=Muribaculaceae bacterium Z82 TaxID=2304548 RepID=A0A7C9KCQ9_9BACT